jgi:holo-[acyl-carrier protein] synthase
MNRGVFWRDMGVVNLAGGQPTMSLTGGAARRLAELTPPGFRPHIHVSLTDEAPLAFSLVIISAELDPMQPGPGA